MLRDSQIQSQLKHLPSALATDYAAIFSLPDAEDVKSQIFLFLAEGKTLYKAIRHARAMMARDQHWHGITRPELSTTEKKSKPKTLAPNFIRLDKTKNDDEMSAHERFSCESHAQANVNTVVINYSHARRATVLSDGVEAMFDQLNGGNRAIANLTGFTIRYIQMQLNQQVDLLQQANNFENGGKGQGSLLSLEKRVEAALAHLTLQRKVKVPKKAELVVTQGCLFAEVS